ncbi:MAG: type II toxin-antitoxin system ParD family antitoxin [Pseudomonadota bacterium]
MNVSLGKKWELFVEQAVSSGRYASSSEVVREGLRLVEERETKLESLRRTLEKSLAEGGSHDDQTISDDLDREYETAKAEGL